MQEASHLFQAGNRTIFVHHFLLALLCVHWSLLAYKKLFHSEEQPADPLRKMFMVILGLIIPSSEPYCVMD